MSRRIFPTPFIEPTSSCMLDNMSKPKPKMLTVKFDLKTYMDYSAAVEVLRGRSMSEHIHQFVIRSIEEARRKVSEEEFRAVIDKKLRELKERSAARSKKSRKIHAVGRSPLHAKKA